MPSSTSYLRDYHDVSAWKYFSTLCVTIIATLENVAAYFVSDRCDDGIELATIIEPEDFQRAPSRAIVKKAVARLEVAFWRRPPMLSRSSIEEEGRWRNRRGWIEWKPPPEPNQSKKKSIKKNRNADLRSSSGGEAVQQQQRQLEDQKQQQQLKEQQPDKSQRLDRTDGAAGEVKETDSSNQPRRITGETCTPSTTSLGASCSFFGSGYSTNTKKANQNETPATAGDSPASSKTSSRKWSTLRAKVKALQRSGVLKKRTASGRLLWMSTGSGEPTKARESRKVFPEGLALIHRCEHSQQRLLSRVEPNRGVESGELLQRKYSGFREEGPERHSRYMRNRLLQRLALLATLFMVGLGGLGGVVAQKKDELGFEVRTYNGTNNNLDNPLWGSVNITQVRAVSAASYSDGVSMVSGDDRPSAREVTTQVFLAASSVRSPRSALFVGWALLTSYDIFLNADDDSLPFDIPCDDGQRNIDVWCPEGSASEDISFNRSQAEVSAVRNPLNLATSYLDLDFMYGRSEEEAKALRTMEGGYMNLTEDGMPIENDDGTWLIGDQRTAVFPVTFALHIMLLREHNICCDIFAPDLGYEGDEDIYQACRGWTIAIFQHITNLDFNVRLTGTNIMSSDEYTPFDDIVSSSYATASSSHESTDSTMSNSTDTTSYTSSPSDEHNRRRLHDLYTGEQNPGADVFATTVGVAAFYAAIPPTVRIMEEGYEPADEDGIELTEAAEDIAGLFKRNSIESIIRGAAFSSTLAVDTHFSSAVSTTSPLFKLPVDAIQRGRDHGVQTYNDAREAYGLSRATSFANVTHDTNVQALLEDAYGGNISRLDALTGALAEGSNMSSSVILGELLQEVWRDQMYRSILGDRLYHRHDVPTTDTENTTLYSLIKRTTNVTDIPLSVFMVPDIMVCYENCSTDGSSAVYLSEEFILMWDIQDDYEYISYTLSAKYIGGAGYMGIGFGGDEMVDASDFLICEVLSSTSAECTDRRPVSTHRKPSEDTENSSLNVTEVVVDGDWTSVTFHRYRSDLDDEDYNIYEDLDGYTETLIIFSYREGEGVGKHANSNRGASSVNFVTGSSTTVCEEDADFYLLHGALILFAWMILMPVGVFFARYCKGKEGLFGNQWWETHAELMVVSSEMVLPLAITAIVSTPGSHNSWHAMWGFYMMAAIAFQVITGILRQRALEGKDSNFSRLHRINKHVHIWAGHVAFFAGAFQCYRGVELVSETDSLHFSAIEDLVEFEVGNFGIVYDYVMPIWFGIIGALILLFETRKQLTMYRREGAAMVCCVYELKNETFVAEGRQVGVKEGEGYKGEDHLMPRTQVLPLYTMDEFNRKVLNGMSWVIVDDAVLDVGNFSRRHPGGARVIVNALGTDISNELKGDDLSIGSAMAFTPHKHSESALKLARSMVVGYIEEEDEEYEGDASSAEQTQQASELGLSVTGNHQSSDETEEERDHMELVLQRFHVCPFMLRKRLDRGKDDDRAVYSYVFACPGEAAVLAEAATGVCYFNMRVVRKNGDSVVQRSYNATAVRVIHNANGEASTTRSRNAHADATIANESMVRVVPAVESQEGDLCVEMRIRLYKDGAMSKLLEQLPSDSTNATVQLQGPFFVDNLSPPPAHRNVIMIAAGTGINPMTQLIQDYQSFDSQDTVGTTERSRLVLLWQVTATSDLYCDEQLHSLEARGRGLLEVMTLVSDSHRRKNDPKVPTTLGRRRKRRAEAADAAPGRFRSAGLSVPRSPTSIRTQSGGGSTVDGQSFVPTSEAKVPQDDAGVATALSIAPRDAVVGSRSAEADGTDETKDSAFKPSQNAGESSLATSVNTVAPREERVMESMEKGEIYQPESDLIRRGQWQLDTAPDTPDDAELITPTPSTLVLAPGMARKPMAISLPVRDLVRGAHNAPRENVIESFSSSSSSFKHAPQPLLPSSCRGTAAFRRRKGKVSKDVLREIFGEGLMQAITGFNAKHPATPETSHQSLDPTGLEADLAALCGTETESGKLQVVLSGPSGFVFYVESMLEEMGVPKKAFIVLE